MPPLDHMPDRRGSPAPAGSSFRFCLYSPVPGIQVQQATDGVVISSVFLDGANSTSPLPSPSRLPKPPVAKRSVAVSAPGPAWRGEPLAGRDVDVGDAPVAERVADEPAVEVDGRVAGVEDHHALYSGSNFESAEQHPVLRGLERRQGPQERRPRGRHLGRQRRSTPKTAPFWTTASMASAPRPGSSLCPGKSPSSRKSPKYSSNSASAPNSAATTKSRPSTATPAVASSSTSTARLKPPPSPSGSPTSRTSPSSTSTSPRPARTATSSPFSSPPTPASQHRHRSASPAPSVPPTSSARLPKTGTASSPRTRMAASTSTCTASPTPAANSVARSSLATPHRR